MKWILVLGFWLTLPALAFGKASLLKLAEDGATSKIRQLPASTDWNQADAGGETALIKAVARSHTDTVKALLRRKSDLDHPDAAGNTALFYAVSNNDKVDARALIAAGASVDLTYGPLKENLLFEAARTGAREIAADLLKKNKNLISQTDSQGRTALFTAIEFAQSALALDLIQAGALVKITTADGQTLADFAKHNGIKADSILGKKIFQSP